MIGLIHNKTCLFYIDIDQKTLPSSLATTELQQLSSLFVITYLFEAHASNFQQYINLDRAWM